MSRQEVQSVVDTAIREAILRRHEYITVEHLLYSILQHDTGVTIISECGGDVDRLLLPLLHFFTEHIPEFPVLSVRQNVPAAESERTSGTFANSDPRISPGLGTRGESRDVVRPAGFGCRRSSGKASFWNRILTLFICLKNRDHAPGYPQLHFSWHNR